MPSSITAPTEQQHRGLHLKSLQGVNPANVATLLRAMKSRKRNWTDEELELLGTLSDSELGRLVNCHPITVANKRKQLGIPAQRSAKPVYRPWSAAEKRLLATNSDGQIARLTGRTLRDIEQQRQKK